MKEIKDIIESYNRINLDENKVALATVIYVEGSSYRRSGARMLIQDNGVWTGGISGGCLEGDALKKANYCIARKKIDVVRYDTSKEDEEQIGVGLGCNGIIDVLIQPIDRDSKNNPIEILKSCLKQRKTNCLLTIISSKRDSFHVGKMYKYTESLAKKLSNELVKDINFALQKGKSFVKDYDDLSIFIEILKPAVNVVLFGYGYDVYPLLKIGNELGWDMNVAVKRDKVNNKLKKSAKKIYTDNNDLPEDAQTAYVLMAHDYETDKKNLLLALQSDVPYIGMLGPLKRRKKALEELKDEGFSFSDEQLSRLYNPIGLDIGADNPEEISLAILAEIKAHFAEKNAQNLREKKTPIHDRA